MKRSAIILCLVLCFILSFNVSALTVIEEDFEDAYPGDDLASLENMYCYFEWNNATGESACDIVKDNGGNALKISGASDLFTIDYIPSEYVFSLDIKPMKDNGMVNIFVRGDMPGALTKINPKNAGINQFFPYYEWDWYRENGGGQGASGCGGSGAVISFKTNGLNIKIKKYAPDGLTITSSSFDVKTGDVDLNAYNNVKITDTGKRIDVYLNGALAAYIVLSDESVKYEEDGTNFDYYKKASVYAANGELKGEVENTRLHYKGSQLAVAGRFETLYIDNIKIAYGDRAIEYLNGEYTPETSAQTTETEKETETAPPETDVQTEEQTTPAETEEETKPAEERSGINKKALIIIIAAVADVIIIAALAVFIPKKKK